MILKLKNSLKLSEQDTKREKRIVSKLNLKNYHLKYQKKIFVLDI